MLTHRNITNVMNCQKKTLTRSSMLLYDISSSMILTMTFDQTRDAFVIQIGEKLQKRKKHFLKDPPPKKNLSPKSHILYSYGMWYSLFWSEGARNHQNLKILVSKFVPRDQRWAGQWFGGGAPFYCFLHFLPPAHTNNLDNISFFATKN